MGDMKFNDQPVHVRQVKAAGRIWDQNYITFEVTCACGETIHGSKVVSKNPEGEFTRVQGFRPDDKKARVSPTSSKWQCPSCREKEEALPVKTRQLPPPPSSPLDPLPPALTPEQEAKAETIKGFNWFTFKKFEGNFYRNGNLIFEEPSGVKAFLHEIPCHLCGEAIRLRHTVTFKDGNPYVVAKGKTVNGPATPIKSGSNFWKHVSCPVAAPEQPTEVKEEATPPVEVPEETFAIADKAEPEVETPVIIEDVAPVEDAAPAPVVVLPPQKSLLSDLERISTDQTYSDDFVRGAFWVALRVMKGGVQ